MKDSPFCIIVSKTSTGICSATGAKMLHQCENGGDNGLLEETHTSEEKYVVKPLLGVNLHQGSINAIVRLNCGSLKSGIDHTSAASARNPTKEWRALLKGDFTYSNLT
ncbi:hypothetical protein KIN20_026861 [Parelaphostrongylus tenuis]|uniref:Uncharacterized protein n=1 Tax=Parelaphostrongylus tenuis TaxID=148309 RepID=A0AAD5QYK1_PARTN|nr:hypothetical protein KIN20_026861 [Parelaphostrongylus tenuis]